MILLPNSARNAKLGGATLVGEFEHEPRAKTADDQKDDNDVNNEAGGDDETHGGNDKRHDAIYNLKEFV